MKNVPIYSKGKAVDQFDYSAAFFMYFLNCYSCDDYFVEKKDGKSFFVFEFYPTRDEVDDILDCLRFLKFDYFILPWSTDHTFRQLVIEIPSYYIFSIIKGSYRYRGEVVKKRF